MTSQTKLILTALSIILFLNGCSTKTEIVERIVYEKPKQYEFQKLDLTGSYIELNEYTMKNVRLDRGKYIVSGSDVNPVLYGVVDADKGEILWTPKGVQRIATASLLELDSVHKGIREYYEWQFDEAMKLNIKNQENRDNDKGSKK